MDIPTAKTKLVGFLTKVVHSTDTMVSQIKAVGAPNVKNGAKIQSGVVSAFTQLRKAFQDAKVAATKLPTNSAKAFSSQGARAREDDPVEREPDRRRLPCAGQVLHGPAEQRGQEGHGLPASRRLDRTGTTLPESRPSAGSSRSRARGARA